MEQRLEFCTMASQVIAYEDLSYYCTLEGNYDWTYMMNCTTLQKYLLSQDLTMNPQLYVKDYFTMEIYGRHFVMMNELPDDEVIIIDRRHPNW